jgi:hypothetical protein
VVVFHEETDCRASGATTETVVQLLLPIDSETRRFFLVEGTPGDMVAPGLFQRKPRIDQIYDIDPGHQVIDKRLGNSPSHIPIDTRITGTKLKGTILYDNAIAVRQSARVIRYSFNPGLDVNGCGPASSVLTEYSKIC